MAALNRPVTATYAVDETIRVDTIDNEDHTFCGIMFPIRAKKILPIEKIIIQSVAVRGQLGNISIWVSKAITSSQPSSGSNTTNNNNTNVSSFRLSPKYWTKVYEQFHKPSRGVYKHMDLTQTIDTTPTPTKSSSSSPSTPFFQPEPIILLPGEVRIMYIHSTLESDAAIVYDNTQTNPFGGPVNASSIRYEDDKIAIHTGKAHLSFIPFGQEPIWGWGNAWRDRREFVGQIQYGTVYKLWHPERHNLFGNKFHKGTEALLLLQRRNTLFARLPDECIYYILHMCHWDWFGDSSREINVRNRTRKRAQREEQERLRIAAEEQQVQVQQQQPACVASEHGHENKLHEVRMKRLENILNSFSGKKIDDEDDDDYLDESEDNDDGDEDENEEDDEDEDENDQDDEDEDENDQDDEDDDADSNASSAWERAHGYRADTSRFIFHHVSSDDESDDPDGNNDDDDNNANDPNMHGRPWFGRRVARQLIVHALGGGGRNSLSHR